MGLNKMWGLIALLSIGLLLFGCTQPPAQQGTAAVTQAPGQATQQAVQATQAGAPLAGLGFEQLLSLNTPTACDVRVTSEGKTYDSKIYFLNKQYRYEVDSIVEGKTFKTIMISKNGVAYMDLNAMKQQNPEVTIPCDWLKMEAQATQEPRPAVSESQLKEIPPVDYKCAPAVFGNEKFDTPGKVCTFDEWMKALTGGAEIPSIPSG